jgi:phytanoyl-CoA hydroxylase
MKNGISAIGVAFARAASAMGLMLRRSASGNRQNAIGAQRSPAASGLWIDAPDAESRIAAAPVAAEIKSIARSIRDHGVAVIKRAHDPDLCRKVVEDYARYAAANIGYVRENLDPLSREKRLVNFHLWSDAAARIGTGASVMDVLDFVFGEETAVYTSLTFKYGSQQPVHRDTPHFATWPRNLFAGAWTALEDVSPIAGPLFYHPGAHRFQVDPHVFLEEATQRLPDAPLTDRLLLALDLYNGEIIRQAPAIAEPVALTVEAGDTVIWHPELPHGGLPADDPMRTRWSIVFHCAPASVQVHQHDRFFTFSGATPPPERYSYISSHGRRVAQAGGVAFM